MNRNSYGLERTSRRPMMAKEHWYLLKVRSSFALIVVQKLRRLNLETILPTLKSIAQKSLRGRPATDYVYCRFALENRLDATTWRASIDILGAPRTYAYRCAPSYPKTAFLIY